MALAVTALVTLAFALPLAAVAHRTVHERAVFGAERDADAVAAVTLVSTDAADLTRALDVFPPVRRARLAVYTPRTTVGAHRVRAAAVARARSGWAGTVAVPGGLAYVRAAAGGSAVSAYVPDAALTRGVGVAWTVLATLGLLLLGASALVADRLARSAVRASCDLAEAAQRLGAGEVEVRVVPSGPPEIATAGAAFNGMADRIASLLANERELIADLSHRLRTPLTALRLNAEALPPGPERERVLMAAKETETQLGAVIEHARAPLREPAMCDLAAVAAERTAYWAVFAADQGRVWRGQGLVEPAQVPVRRQEAVAALDAVLGNVFQHTPPGTSYRVSVQRAAGRVRLVVDDAGPGIGTPTEALRRGASGTESTGLGLDIARRVAEDSGGDLRVEPSPLGGTRIALTFRTG